MSAAKKQPKQKENGKAPAADRNAARVPVKPRASSIGDWSPAYLAVLAKNRGQKTKAAEAAGVCFVTVRSRRMRDPEFKAAEAEVMESVADAIESEIYRRAMDGVIRERYGKDGKLVSVETEYSDTLLLAAAKRIDPSWREKQTIDHNVTGFATREERKAAMAAALNGRS